MNLFAVFLFGLAILMAAWVNHAKGRATAAERRYRNLVTDHEERDWYLDWLLRQYVLNVADPYVDRPTIVSIKQGLPVVDSTEKRCFHCNAPTGVDHQKSCPWVIIRPLTQKLYPATPQPVPAPKASTIGLSLTP